MLQKEPAEGPAKPKEEKAESSQPLSLWDTLDRNHFKERMEEGDIEGALDYLTYKVDEVIEARENNLKESELKSWGEFRSQMSEFKESQGIFEQFAERTDNDGKPLYPEFHEDLPENRAFIERVAKRWKEMPGRKEMVKSGNGEYSVYLAYLAERDWQGFQKGPEPPAPEETKTEVSEPPKPQRTPAPGVSTGSGMPRAASRGSRSAEQAQILRDLDEVMREDDPTLGL